ncbi:MAG: bile acid:sodium symporter [Planctomycetota bacterium]
MTGRPDAPPTDLSPPARVDHAAAAVAAWMRHRFLLLLLAVYAVAVAVPWPGMWLREREFLTDGMPLTRVLLTVLLFNAGLAVSAKGLSESFGRPQVLVFAVFLRFLIAGAVALFAAATLPAAMGGVVIGLTLMAVVPAAGSSPAWTHASGGLVSTSLGIVAVSTLCGPIAGSLLFGLVGPFLAGDHQEVSTQLVARLASAQVVGWILLPPVAGAALRSLLGEERVRGGKPWISLINLVLLLVLIYAFAAASMRQVLVDGRYGLLATAAVAAALMAGVNFAAGATLGWRRGRDRGERVALLYGIGMQNNGVAMLIGGMALAADSPAFLPMIAHALVQHLAAGTAATLLERRGGDGNE